MNICDDFLLLLCCSLNKNLVGFFYSGCLEERDAKWWGADKKRVTYTTLSFFSTRAKGYATSCPMAGQGCWIFECIHVKLSRATERWLPRSTSPSSAPLELLQITCLGNLNMPVWCRNTTYLLKIMSSLSSKTFFFSVMEMSYSANESRIAFNGMLKLPR